MKRKYIVLLLLLTSMLAGSCSSSTTDAVQSIRWYTLADGLAAARESGKQLMLYTQAQW